MYQYIRTLSLSIYIYIYIYIYSLYLYHWDMLMPPLSYHTLVSIQSSLPGRKVERPHSWTWGPDQRRFETWHTASTCPSSSIWIHHSILNLYQSQLKRQVTYSRLQITQISLKCPTISSPDASRPPSPSNCYRPLPHKNATKTLVTFIQSRFH